MVTPKLEHSPSKVNKMLNFLKEKKGGVVNVMESMTRSFWRCYTSVPSVPSPHSWDADPKESTECWLGLCATWNRKSGGEKSQNAGRGDAVRNGRSLLFRRIKFGETAH